MVGRPQNRQHFAAVWEKLRSALIAEMKKRGLWNAPPGYLGIHGTASWTDGDAFPKKLDLAQGVIGRAGSENRVVSLPLQAMGKLDFLTDVNGPVTGSVYRPG